MDVFTPCHGGMRAVHDTTSDQRAPTCLWCVASRFADNVRAMNLDAIEHLDEGDLVAHFVDRGAMSLAYDDGA